MKLRNALNSFNKKVVAAMVAAAILLSTLVGASAFKYMNAKAKDQNNTEMTVQVTKQDIQSTLSATGTIISAEESGQFATTTNSYPVQEVYVKVGDVVKKGDPLYKLDMTSMKETLSYQQQALNLQKQQNDINAQSANKALQDAKDNGVAQVNDTNRSLAQSEQDKASADRNQSNSNSQLNASKNAESDARRALDSANATVNSAQNTINSLNAKISELQNKISSVNPEDGSIDLNVLKNELEQTKKDFESAKSALSDKNP